MKADLLDRYLFRQVSLGVAATIGVLTPLVWLMQILRLLPLLSQQGISFALFGWMTLLVIPGLVEVVLPISVFVAILAVYTRSTTDRELVVMAAAGRSPSQSARPAIACTLLCVALGYLLTLLIVPYCARETHRVQVQLRNQVSALMLQDGVFSNVSPRVTVYIRRKDPDSMLHGLLIEDDREPGHHVTVMAHRGILAMNGHLPLLVMEDGTRQQIDPHSGRLEMVYFTRETISLTSDRRRFEGPGMEEMSLRSLFNPPSEVPDHDHGRLSAEGWRRLSDPLISMALGMIALNTVLLGRFSRHASLRRPATAILTVMLIMGANLFMRSLSTRYFFIGASSPELFLAIVFFCIRKIRTKKYSNSMIII